MSQKKVRCFNPKTGRYLNVLEKQTQTKHFADSGMVVVPEEKVEPFEVFTKKGKEVEEVATEAPKEVESEFNDLDELTEEELKEMYKTKFGRNAHHKLTKESLIEKLK